MTVLGPLRPAAVIVLLLIAGCTPAEEESVEGPREGAEFLSEYLRNRLRAACPGALDSGASATGVRDGLYRSCRTAVADTELYVYWGSMGDVRVIGRETTFPAKTIGPAFRADTAALARMLDSLVRVYEARYGVPVTCPFDDRHRPVQGWLYQWRDSPKTVFVVGSTLGVPGWVGVEEHHLQGDCPTRIGPPRAR